VKIDLEQIKSLLDVVGTTDITELSIESGEEKITIKKQHTIVAQQLEVPVMHRAAMPHAQNSVSSAGAAPEPEAKGKIDDDGSTKGLIPITSPMVGTFYRAPSPTSPAFVDIGDVIAAGQTVCIIEAMKLMNDLPAEVSGRIVKVCVESGTTVEYGQPLFMVNPKG
jgi:oxaloacetate decarboxylase alpha subunit